MAVTFIDKRVCDTKEAKAGDYAYITHRGTKKRYLTILAKTGYDEYAFIPLDDGNRWDDGEESIDDLIKKVLADGHTIEWVKDVTITIG